MFFWNWFRVGRLGCFGSQLRFDGRSAGGFWRQFPLHFLVGGGFLFVQERIQQQRFLTFALRRSPSRRLPIQRQRQLRLRRLRRFRQNPRLRQRCRRLRKTDLRPGRFCPPFFRRCQEFPSAVPASCPPVVRAK